MTKRSRQGKKSILGSFQFNKIDPYGGVEADASAKKLHIDAIMPDPGQPRRLLPKALYQQLYSGKQRPTTVLKAWLDGAQAKGATPSHKEAVANLRQLAATIEHSDLINPITVREAEVSAELPVGITHLIVTGERRWWSHVLLTLEERTIGTDGYPDRIRATIVKNTNIRALQLIENMAREDLSLVDKAKGIISFREELNRTTENPTWTQVEKILGVSRSYRSRILKVLKLTPEAQEIVARYNLPEKTIRPITEGLSEKPALQLRALQQIVTWGQIDGSPVSHSRTAGLVKSLLGSNASQKQPTTLAKRANDPVEPSGFFWMEQFHRRIFNLLEMFEHLKEAEQREIAATFLAGGPEIGRARLRSLRKSIDKLLASAEAHPSDTN